MFTPYNPPSEEFPPVKLFKDGVPQFNFTYEVDPEVLRLIFEEGERFPIIELPKKEKVRDHEEEDLRLLNLVRDTLYSGIEGDYPAPEVLAELTKLHAHLSELRRTSPKAKDARFREAWLEAIADNRRNYNQDTDPREENLNAHRDDYEPCICALNNARGRLFCSGC
jgi:hypothetical protein